MIEHPDDITADDFGENCKIFYQVRICNATVQTRTLIMIAARFGLVVPLRVLLGIDRIKSMIDFTNPQGQTALITMSMYYNNFPTKVECMKLLLEHGANVNIRDDYGVTALIGLVMKPCKTANGIECVRMLLANRAKINVKPKHGYTALEHARRTDSVECAEMIEAELARRTSEI